MRYQSARTQRQFIYRNRPVPVGKESEMRPAKNKAAEMPGLHQPYWRCLAAREGGIGNLHGRVACLASSIIIVKHHRARRHGGMSSW